MPAVDDLSFLIIGIVIVVAYHFGKEYGLFGAKTKKRIKRIVPLAAQFYQFSDGNTIDPKGIYRNGENVEFWLTYRFDPDHPDMVIPAADIFSHKTIGNDHYYKVLMNSNMTYNFPDAKLNEVREALAHAEDIRLQHRSMERISSDDMDLEYAKKSYEFPADILKRLLSKKLGKWGFGEKEEGGDDETPEKS